MSLLTFMQDVAKQLGLKEPSTVVGNTDPTIKQLLSLLEKDLQEEVKTAFTWPEFIREHTFTVATDTASYELPEDFDRFQYETHWDQSQTWPIDGPISPQEWALRNHGTNTTSPRSRFRVKGIADAQFYLHPTPGSDENGNTYSYEYFSKTWIRPTAWVTSTAFAAGSYCFNDGNIYQTSAGGTTGATAPTHTTGSASDGTVTWTYVSAPYDQFVADTDEFLLPEQIYRLGLRYYWRETHGLDSVYYMQRFEQAMRNFITKKKGARRFNLAARRGSAGGSYKRGPLQDFGGV